MFSAWAMGISSRSGMRSMRLYSTCKPDKRRPSAKLSERVGLGDPPCGSIGDADVEHFALADEVVERAHDLFDGRESVPNVHPVKVDVAGLQALEAGFDGLDHALAVVACSIWGFCREWHYCISSLE